MWLYNRPDLTIKWIVPINGLVKVFDNAVVKSRTQFKDDVFTEKLSMFYFSYTQELKLEFRFHHKGLFTCNSDELQSTCSIISRFISELGQHYLWQSVQLHKHAVKINETNKQAKRKKTTKNFPLSIKKYVINVYMCIIINVKIVNFGRCMQQGFL